MSGEKQETMADIVREMRIFKCRNLETGELETCNAIANYFADRLEAADNLECCKTEQMRKALERIVSLTNSLDENCAVDPVEIRDIAREALNGRKPMFVDEATVETNLRNQCESTENLVPKLSDLSASIDASGSEKSARGDNYGSRS